jgi:hypothetical protein
VSGGAVTDQEVLMERLIAGASSTRNDYLEALSQLDIAVCEALAVGQAQAGRFAPACVGYATYVFARLCSYGVAAVRAAPMSRWTNSDHQEWGFNVLACHARAILEGYLYFTYLIQPTTDELEEGRARITLLQLNDCCSRMKLLSVQPEQREFLEIQAEELRQRLKSIPFFQQLPEPVQKKSLVGKKAWFLDRAQLVELVGMEKPIFDIAWDLFSQYSHVHPISFYRIEPNGRGTGLECDPDRAYLAFAMILSSVILIETTDRMVQEFPDVAGVRKGINSKFGPGPKSNRHR